MKDWKKIEQKTKTTIHGLRWSCSAFAKGRFLKHKFVAFGLCHSIFSVIKNHKKRILSIHEGKKSFLSVIFVVEIVTTT